MWNIAIHRGILYILLQSYTQSNPLHTQRYIKHYLYRVCNLQNGAFKTEKFSPVVCRSRRGFIRYIWKRWRATFFESTIINLLWRITVYRFCTNLYEDHLLSNFSPPRLKIVFFAQEQFSSVLVFMNLRHLKKTYHEADWKIVNV